MTARADAILVAGAGSDEDAVNTELKGRVDADAGRGMTGTAFDLTGKTALVTGAGSGLGARFAAALAAAGAHVFCVDVNETTADKVANGIVLAGGRATPIACDVSCSRSIDEMMVRSEGRIDILVNNAGIVTRACRTHEMPEEAWDRCMTVNLKSAFLCARAVLPAMVAQGAGSIINISSILGLRGYFPGFVAVAANYSASKAALIGFTKQLAVEYARDGIRANAICPGFHEGTALGMEWRSLRTPDQARDFRESIETRTPIGRQGRPDEIGGLIAYLASDASRYVTGQVIAHDGGWTAT